MRCRRRHQYIYFIVISVFILVVIDNSTNNSNNNNNNALTRLLSRVDDFAEMTSSYNRRSPNYTTKSRLNYVASTINSISDGCDEECQRLHAHLQSWPTDKPKSAIYFLIQNSSLSLLRKSFAAFDRFFNDQFNYPVIIFFEKDMNTPAGRQYIQSMTNSSVFFQIVTFQLPTFLTKPVPEKIRGKNRVYGVGYRHMCRFHAKTVYDHAILRNLDYAWRLDHDSFITRPIGYDIFKFMKERDLVYGFVKIYLELPTWTVGLWNAANDYIKNNSLKTHFFNKWRRNMMYYNNFEISKLSLWFSDEYQKFINYIDHQGGIYYHRWGDAPIKSIAVAMFVEKKRTHNFKDLGYIHQFYKHP